MHLNVHRSVQVWSFLVLVAVSANGRLEAQQTAFTPPADISWRTVNIMSEGTRIHAEVFQPRANERQPLPAIIQATGWGGQAASLRNDAVDFARAGYTVINFDYRGWGQSDARVILTSPAPQGQGLKYTAEVLEVRGVVDPIDQTTDWHNVVNWAMGEPVVNPDAVGLRGLSLSGGHVVYVAAHDPRIRAITSNAPATHPYAAIPPMFEISHEEATKRARGEIGYPEPRVREYNLTGIPIYESFVRYDPNSVAHRMKAAALFIPMSEEELYNNESQARVAYDRAQGPKAYVVLDGGHYAIYNESRDEALRLAIDWYDRFLKPHPYVRLPEYESQVRQRERR